MVTTKHYTMEPGRSGLELLESDEMYPGYYYFTVSLKYMGISMKRKIGNQLVHREFPAYHEEDVKAPKKNTMETVIRFAKGLTSFSRSSLQNGIPMPIFLLMSWESAPCIT